MTLVGNDEEMLIMDFVAFQFTLQDLSVQHLVKLTANRLTLLHLNAHQLFLLQNRLKC